MPKKHMELTEDQIELLLKAGYDESALGAISDGIFIVEFVEQKDEQGKTFLNLSDYHNGPGEPIKVFNLAVIRRSSRFKNERTTDRLDAAFKFLEDLHIVGAQFTKKDAPINTFESNTPDNNGAIWPSNAQSTVRQYFKNPVSSGNWKAEFVAMLALAGRQKIAPPEPVKQSVRYTASADFLYMWDGCYYEIKAGSFIDDPLVVKRMLSANCYPIQPINEVDFYRCEHCHKASRKR